MVLEAPGRRQRRRHSLEFKESVIRACRHPGVSIASVALANGLNANMLRKWVIEAERTEKCADSPAAGQRRQSPPTMSFIPLPLPAPATVDETMTDIRVEIQRSGMTVTVTWPAGAAAQCAAWLREWLR